MTNFTVRVVLHGVDEDDSEKYTELHDQMRKQGFSRQISYEGASNAWKLPPAEYSKVTTDEGQVVLGAAKKAALAVMGNEKKFSVLVTGSEKPRIIHNLEPAKK